MLTSFFFLPFHPTLHYLLLFLYSRVLFRSFSIGSNSITTLTNYTFHDIIDGLTYLDISNLNLNSFEVCDMFIIQTLPNRYHMRIAEFWFDLSPSILIIPHTHIADWCIKSFAIIAFIAFIHLFERRWLQYTKNNSVCAKYTAIVDRFARTAKSCDHRS